MMLFREKQQIAIFCLAGVMVGAFVLFRYMPLQKRIKAVELRLAEARLAISRARHQSEQLPMLKEQLLRLQRTGRDYEANVPEQRDLGLFLHRIADLMNKHNLKGQLIQPGKEIQAEGLSCIPINMQCKGRLTQIFEFCKSLQGLDRSVRIERVKLVNDRDFSGEVTMQTTAVVYYRADSGRG